jgi:hypothetical protein
MPVRALLILMYNRTKAICKFSGPKKATGYADSYEQSAPAYAQAFEDRTAVGK